MQYFSSNTERLGAAWCDYITDPELYLAKKHQRGFNDSGLSVKTTIYHHLCSMPIICQTFKSNFEWLGYECVITSQAEKIWRSSTSNKSIALDCSDQNSSSALQSFPTPTENHTWTSKQITRKQAISWCVSQLPMARRGSPWIVAKWFNLAAKEAGLKLQA